MKILIDLGNTRLKWRWWTPAAGLGDGGVLVHQQAETLTVPSAWGPVLQAGDCRSVLISSVAAPPVRQTLADTLHALSPENVAVEWLQSPAAGLGLRNSYANPAKLGIDRWLALAGAHAESGKASCVIDVGTAITVDICDEHGVHQGGLIAPGPSALAQALSRHTALPSAAQDKPESLGLAQDTEEALLLGTLHCACGLIERAFRIAQQEHGCEQAVLTGGGLYWLREYLQIPWQEDPDLVFKGLALAASADR